MELFKFIFSSFWVWLGTLCLLYVVFEGIVDVVKACKRNRKITAYRMDGRWHVQIDNASAGDVDVAVYGPGEDKVEVLDEEGKRIC